MVPLILAAAAGVAGTLAVSKIVDMMNKNFYTTKDVATLLNISEYTVRKKIRDGEIKASGGKSYRISKEDLETYIKNNATDNLESVSPEILESVIEVKEMELKKLNLQLQQLELEADDLDPKDFKKKQIALEIAVSELEAEIKKYRIVQNLKR